MSSSLENGLQQLLHEHHFRPYLGHNQQYIKNDCQENQHCEGKEIRKS